MNLDKINMVKSYLNTIEQAIENIEDVLSDSKDDMIEDNYEKEDNESYSRSYPSIIPLINR